MKKNYCSYYTIVMKKKENNLNSQIFDEIKKRDSWRPRADQITKKERGGINSRRP